MKSIGPGRQKDNGRSPCCWGEDVGEDNLDALRCVYNCSSHGKNWRFGSPDVARSIEFETRASSYTPCIVIHIIDSPFGRTV